jgi:uncharacterized membrane protein
MEKSEEKKKEQLNRNYKFICVVITVLSYSHLIYLLFIQNTINKIPFSYIFGCFLGSSVLPLIFWVIYFIINSVQKVEIRELAQYKMNKISSSEYGQDFTSKLKSLNELHSLGAISLEEFELKKQNLLLRTEFLISKTEELLNYSNDSITYQTQIQKLKDAVEDGLISEEEYLLKVKKINEIELVIKQRIEHIKKEIEQK